MKPRTFAACIGLLSILPACFAQAQLAKSNINQPKFEQSSACAKAVTVSLTAVCEKKPNCCDSPASCSLVASCDKAACCEKVASCVQNATCDQSEVCDQAVVCGSKPACGTTACNTTAGTERTCPAGAWAKLAEENTRLSMKVELVEQLAKQREEFLEELLALQIENTQLQGIAETLQARLELIEEFAEAQVALANERAEMVQRLVKAEIKLELREELTALKQLVKALQIQGGTPAVVSETAVAPGTQNAKY